MSRDEAFEVLADMLHLKMMRMDPNSDAKMWGDLSDDRKEFYRLAVRELFTHPDLIKDALGTSE